MPTLVTEMGVGNRITPKYCRDIVDGIFNLMSHMGIWDDEPKEVNEPIISTEGEVTFLTAKESGIFVSAVDSMGRIGIGTHIGDIIEPIEGRIIQRIESPTDGIIFTLRENPVVHKGALIYRVLFDGALIASSTTLLKNASIAAVQIGARSQEGHFHQGWLDSYRIKVGEALVHLSFHPRRASRSRHLDGLPSQPSEHRIRSASELGANMGLSPWRLNRGHKPCVTAAGRFEGCVLQVDPGRPTSVVSYWYLHSSIKMRVSIRGGTSVVVMVFISVYSAPRTAGARYYHTGSASTRQLRHSTPKER